MSPDVREIVSHPGPELSRYLLQSLSWDAVRLRSQELRRLTNAQPNSDLNEILDQAEGGPGSSVFIAGALAEENGVAVGWAVCEAFRVRHRSNTLFSVFVHPDHRSQGLGTALLCKVVETWNTIPNTPEVWLEAEDFTSATLRTLSRELSTPRSCPDTEVE